MPQIAVKCVTDTSGEDSDNKLVANNLLAVKDYKSWKCPKWETTAHVVLELCSPSQISSIEIGNDCSAFVEVLVSRADDPKRRFQVLLSASSFMTPSESNSVINCNRVRVFNREKLSPNSVNEKWDFVKVVCTQPFNKTLCYGLSFIKLNAPKSATDDDEPMSTSLNVGPFKLSAESRSESLDVGSLFSKRTALNANGEPSVTPKRTSLAAAVGISPKASVNSSRNSGGDTGSDQQKSDRQRNTQTVKPLPSMASTSNASLSPQPSKSASKPPKPTAVTPPKRQRIPKVVPFTRVMSKVVFTLSGYVNPRRSELRDKALEMGAKYRPNWDTSCTHLICAFVNTPKFNEVSAKRGRIVRDKWIDDCYAQRKPIPWRVYMLGKYNGLDSPDESDSEDDNTNGVRFVDSDDEVSQSPDSAANNDSTIANQAKNLNIDKSDAIFDAETDNEDDVKQQDLGLI